MAPAPSLVINLPGYPFENFPSVGSIALLRAIPSAGLLAGDNYVVDGSTAPGDGGGGVYAWSDSSTATDDGSFIIKPDDISPGQAGRWVQAGGGSFADFMSTAPGKGGEMVAFIQLGAGAVAETVTGELRKKVTYGQHSTLDQSISLAGVLRDVDLAGQVVDLSANPNNQFGTRFRNGKVLVPSSIATYKTQQNTYADEVSGFMHGRANLATWRLSVEANTFQTIPIAGDSTVEMGPAYPFKAHELFKDALYDAGINCCLTSNLGVSGTSWSDLDVTALLAGNPKLVVIKYGINDAAKVNPLATMMADARDKLTQIRAAKSFYDTSILLMGPNSANRPSANQDPKWFEDVRNAYLQLMKEFNCAYFDVYAYLQQTQFAPGLWLDSFDGGQGIHPLPSAVRWIWHEGIKEEVLGGGYWSSQKSNRIVNTSHGMQQRNVLEAPQLFPYGASQWGALTATGGWLFNGALFVERQADGITRQTLVSIEQTARAITRTGSGLNWTQWEGVVNPISTFTNSWVNAGGGFGEARYVVDLHGEVQFYGKISGGTSGSSAFTLPAAIIPEKTEDYPTRDGYITVFGVTGTVIPTVTSTANVTLTGIRFPVKG